MDHEIPELEPPGQGGPPGRPITVRVFGFFFALIGIAFAAGVFSLRSPGQGPPLAMLVVVLLMCGAFVLLGLMTAFGPSGRGPGSTDSDPRTRGPDEWGN